MKKSRFITEQIIAILQEHASGAAPAELIRRYGISFPTVYHWKKKYSSRRRRPVPGSASSGRRTRAGASRACTGGSRTTAW